MVVAAEVVKVEVGGFAAHNFHLLEADEWIADAIITYAHTQTKHFECQKRRKSNERCWYIQDGNKKRRA